jgi:hypothetical protein
VDSYFGDSQRTVNAMLKARYGPDALPMEAAVPEAKAPRVAEVVEEVAVVGLLVGTPLLAVIGSLGVPASSSVCREEGSVTVPAR